MVVKSDDSDELAEVWINDGQGRFGRLQEQLEGPTSTETVDVALCDLDGDRDLDAVMLLAGYGVDVWLTESDTTPVPGVLPGDANRDGVFDQRDIVLVLQADKYLTGLPATWSQGDWNGDGLFDQADLIAALQAGNYLPGFG